MALVALRDVAEAYTEGEDVPAQPKSCRATAKRGSRTLSSYKMPWPRINALEARFPRLYHYEKFCPNWLETTLRDQKIFCSNPASLNDPWDCKPQFDETPMSENPEEMEAMLQIYRETAAGMDIANNPVRLEWERQVRTDPAALRNSIEIASQKLHEAICERRIYCLTPCPRSTLMWSHYAANHSGICLEFYPVNALFLKAWKVRYCEKYPVWVPQEMGSMEVILTKSQDWAREQEFRIVGSPYHETGNALKLDGDYLTLPPRALQSVIVGCLGDYEAVSRIVAEYAPRLPVKRAVRTPNHYSLTIEEPR